MDRIASDVLIIGSGFAGSLCALILKRVGLEPIVIDKAKHPRFAIGESSTPIANMVFSDLAAKYDLDRLTPLHKYGLWKESYPHLIVGRKRGFSYFYHQSEQEYSPDPGHANELLVAASSDDFHCDTHWLRSDLDAFLASELQNTGIPLFEDTTITGIQQGSTWRIDAEASQSKLRFAPKFVVDASGEGRVLENFLGLKQDLSNIYSHSRALYSHFDSVVPWQSLLQDSGARVDDHPFACDDSALHHILDDSAWMWQLRFNNDRVSAGLVLDAKQHPLNRQYPIEEEWNDWLKRYPSMEAQFAAATIARVPGILFRTSRLQRRVIQAAGANWAMLPFTAGFIDPLHSTGIAHSLVAVERLTRIIEMHWGKPSFQEPLRGYESSVFRELEFIDKLVYVCYESMNDFRLFAASTMLYFAATITYEQLRSHARSTGKDLNINNLFLSAEDKRLSSTILSTIQQIHQLGRKDSLSEQDISDYESIVEEAIAPYNSVGLFHSAVPNMYHHTAANV